MQGFGVLLLLLPATLANLPFYCRFRKPNCTLRPNTKCCPPVVEETTVETLAPTTTILPEPSAAAAAATVVVVSRQQDLPDEPTEEKVDEVENAPRNEEDLQAEPSQIREVIVDPPEINQIPTSSERPDKYAPRFCLVLKYNCKSRSSHPCCRHPLPPRNPLPGSVPVRNPNKVRPTRKSIPQRPPLRRGGSAAGEDGEVTTQRTRRPRPSLRTPPTSPATPKNSGTPRRSALRRPRPPRPTWKTTTRPRPRPRPTRQRPRFGSGKSPVCRIINCKRNPVHKCCREPTTTTTTSTTTTTEGQDTTLDALLTSTTPVSVTEAVDVGELGDMVVSHVASVSSVETRLVAATSPRRKNLPRDEIEEGGEEEEQVLEESEEETQEEMEMGKEEVGEMTTMSYTELELATPHQEEAPALEMMYETTLKPQADVDNAGSDNGGEVNVESSSQIVNKSQHNNNPDLGDTVIHIGGGGGDSVFQEIVPVITVTPTREPVNNVLYEEQLKREEEEEMSSQGGVLAPLYVEAQSTGNQYGSDTSQVTIVYPTPPGGEWEPPTPQWEEAASPVFIPYPVFVPERGEKDRIRQEVEERIVLEEKRLEEEERRRKLEIVRREENAQRLVQEEERRRQEVEYWRQQVQEEEERRRQEEELRLRIREEEERKDKEEEEEERLRREKEVREEVLVPAASSREARIAVANLQRIAVGNLLETDNLEGRKESVELPPRVRMECFRFDCLSAPSDPCCSRSKRQIEAYEAPTFKIEAYEAPTFKIEAYEAPTFKIEAYEAPTFKSFEQKQAPTVHLFEEEEEPSSLQSLHQLPLRRPLLPGWRVEATVTRVEKSVHWGE